MKIILSVPLGVHLGHGAQVSGEDPGVDLLHLGLPPHLPPGRAAQQRPPPEDAQVGLQNKI